jgi:hypothetical protein
MGGENATRSTKRGSGAAGSTKKALYERAKSERIEGRSKMSKQQLENALHH